MEMILHNEFTDEQLESYLQQVIYKISEKPEVPPQILWVDDCAIATFGNFSASTGKAKSKKTFNVSAMVAAAMTNGTVLKYRATLPEGKRKILYFDTEQSCMHCYNVMERIFRLSGLPVDKDDDRLTFVGLREYTPSLRLSLIDYTLRSREGFGLVIIDGLRDLMYDINNPREATDVMTMLMAWTSRYNLHIHCVLHLNKGDNNTRGHIGTELDNKAETVLVISKSKEKKEVSEVMPMHMRDKEFEAFAFHVDENALPALEEDYHVTVVTPKIVDLFSLPDSLHKEVLDEVFGTCPPMTYNELVTSVSEGYAKRGYGRGKNAVKKLIARMVEKSILMKDESAGYLYDPNFIDFHPQV
jgi:hypothetical protein